MPLNAGIAPGEITANQLSEQVLKYFKPELIQSPQAPANVYTGQQITLGAQAQGKHLTYQWQRDGQSIPGATNAQFIITDANASQHDGNYSLMISNDFGDVTTTAVQIVVSTGQASTHTADLNASVSSGHDLGGTGHFYDGAGGVCYAGARGHPDQWLLLG